MTSEPLGHDPEIEPLILTAGADYELVLNPETGTYPIGMTGRISFYAASATDAAEIDSWDSTTATTSELSWRIESEVADLIPKGLYYRLYAIFDETPTLERCWYRGKVQRKQ